ncbi:MAG: hypothetical protein QOE70_5969 [Chthoniobacter sp.]|jgi:hypothetical protein|nr:hypothetical protein [Chthoniobacter sp.]
MSIGASYSGTSATFYGGGRTQGTNSGFFDAPGTTFVSGIWNSSSGDAIMFHWLGKPGGTAQGVIFWKKEDFLNGSSDKTVTFNSTSQFTLAPSSQASYVSPTRWLVEDSGNFYLSQTVVSASATLLDPNASTLWASYTPQTDIRFNSATANFTARSFSNVQAVGYYFFEENQGNAEYVPNVANFSVTAFIVPEPSSFLLLGVTGAALLSQRRLRGKVAT